MTLSHQPLNGFPAPAQTWPGSAFNPGAATPVTGEQIEAWREQFIELILQAVVQAVKGVFVPGSIGSAFDQLVDWADNLADSLGLGTLFDNLQALFGGDFSLADFDIQAAVERLLGIDLEQLEFPYEFPVPFSGSANPLQQWFINLREFLSFDFLADGFDPLAAATVFIENILKPVDLLATLVNGVLPDSQAPKLVHDIIEAITGIIGAGPAKLAEFFERIRAFLSFDFLGDTWDVDDAAIGFITNILKPQGLLATLTGGRLPDVEAPPVVDEIIDNLLNGVDDLLDPIGEAAAGLWGLIANIWGGVNRNTTELAAISAQLAGDAAGGGSISSDFSGAQSTSLPGFTKYDSGAGTGSIGLRGDGTTEFYGVTSAIRTTIARSNTALTTNTQHIRIVMPNKPKNDNPDAQEWLLGRCNSDATSYVAVNIVYQEAYLFTSVAGVITSLGSATFSQSDGATYDLYLGSATDDRHFVFKANNTTIIDTIDTGDVSQLGALYLYPGFAQVTGQGFFGGGIQPERLTSFTAADRTP